MISLFIHLFASADINSPTTGPDWPFLTIRKPAPIKSGTAAKKCSISPFIFQGDTLWSSSRTGDRCRLLLSLFCSDSVWSWDGFSFASVFLWLPITSPGDRTCDFREILLAKPCQGSALKGCLLSNQNVWLKQFQNGSYLLTAIISNGAVTMLTMLGAGLNLCEVFGKFSCPERQFSQEQWNIGIPRAPSSSSSHSCVKK